MGRALVEDSGFLHGTARCQELRSQVAGESIPAAHPSPQGRRDPTVQEPVPEAIESFSLESITIEPLNRSASDRHGRLENGSMLSRSFRQTEALRMHDEDDLR